MNIENKRVFHSLIARIGSWLSSGQTDDELVEYFVRTIEPNLKHVRGYKKILERPLQICREHCRGIIDEIPGPIHIKRSGHNDDPFIKAAFAQPERIGELLVQADLSSASSALSGDKRVALLTMTSKEKTIFGRKLQGDMIVGDAAMRTITFADHNIVGLATNLEASKVALEKLSLEIIAEAAARELSEIRTKLVDLQERRERLRAMNKMFGSSYSTGSLLVPFDPEKQEKQKKLDEMLAETESEIASASDKAETPADWLNIVVEFLSKPEDILSMHQVTLRLDWRNVLTEDPQEDANTITFASFILTEEMQREGVLVEYSSI